MIVMMLFVIDERGAGEPEHPRRPSLLNLLAHLLDDLVLALEEPKASASVRQVVNVVRERLNEAVHLVDELRNERRTDREDHDEHDQIGERDCRSALQVPAALDPADERVEGKREEQRDDDPRDHVARDPDHLEHECDGYDDQQDPKDRARAQIDHALRRHRTSITRTSDVVTVRI